MRKMTCQAWALAGGLGALGLLAGGCGDTSDTSATSPTSATSEVGGAGKTVTVTATDYKFEGLPKSVKAGTKLEIVNASTKELHEIVASRLPDTEKRPVAELLKLPEKELEALFPPGPPALVVLAAPNRGAPIPAVGDGTLTAKGRYMIGCFVPTGADPAAYLKAAEASTGGPPDVPGGAPHIAQGMFGEITVT